MFIVRRCKVVMYHVAIERLTGFNSRPFIASAEDEDYVFESVLFDCQLDYSRNYEWTLMTFCVRVGQWPWPKNSNSDCERQCLWCMSSWHCHCQSSAGFI